MRQPSAKAPHPQDSPVEWPLADGLNRPHGPREDEEDGLGGSGRGWLFPASTEEGIKGFGNDGLRIQPILFLARFQ